VFNTKGAETCRSSAAHPNFSNISKKECTKEEMESFITNRLITPKNELCKLICEVFLNTYGNTLWEDNTDLIMAKALIKKLKPWLHKSGSDMSDLEFVKWRKRFVEKLGGKYEQD